MTDPIYLIAFMDTGYSLVHPIEFLYQEISEKKAKCVIKCFWGTPFLELQARERTVLSEYRISRFVNPFPYNDTV